MGLSGILKYPGLFLRWRNSNFTTGMVFGGLFGPFLTYFVVVSAKYSLSEPENGCFFGSKGRLYE